MGFCEGKAAPADFQGANRSLTSKGVEDPMMLPAKYQTPMFQAIGSLPQVRGEL